ncbi:hypothetical protein EYF80_058344 [Liparis tanakae]|uniref:Uncharacterized protein n=1 Tax=Liparis tanakae TaxID=230148 RepID=A0A4Z2ERP2_9TELE|nr:hypothetical protein EYF80_058344 [Liparis tanakae]
MGKKLLKTKRNTFSCARMIRLAYGVQLSSREDQTDTSRAAGEKRGLLQEARRLIMTSCTCHTPTCTDNY